MSDESIFPTEYDADVRAQAQACGVQLKQKTSGMSLRDYFAAKAMQGELAGQYEGCQWYDLEKLAAYTYKVADAMLKARGEPNGI